MLRQHQSPATGVLNFRCARVKAAATAGDEGNPCPVGREPASGGAADAARGAGDDDNFLFRHQQVR